MTEIKAGPELDRAVAEAIADTGNRHPEGYMGPSLPVPFQPSTDLNDAFAAADTVGLFDDGETEAVLQKKTDHWIVCFEDDTSRMGGASSCEAPTPSLVICAAILKLKGKER